LYGVDYPTEYNSTPLILATLVGNVSLVKELIKMGANRNIINARGLTPWQMILEIVLFESIVKRLFSFTEDTISKLHKLLMPTGIDLMIDGKLVKLDSRLGEFLLFNYFYLKIPMEYERIETITDSAKHITEVFSNLPDSMILDYRRKRTYISSLLSKNEVHSKNPYCRKLFKRIKRGYYILNPEIKIRHNEEWINVYQLRSFDNLKRILWKNIYS
ncbi:MAG: hypothetical protein D6828_04420, partial [Nitrospirae bacterium]